MKSFELINNYFIGKKSYLERSRSQDPDMTMGPSLFSRKDRFFIPREYDGLAQMSLKVTMTTDADNSNRIPLWQTKVFKSIQLRTKNGVTLQTIYPSYTHYRITSADGDLNSQLTDAINPVPSFNNTTSVFFLPLFFWFSENSDLALRTRYLEELELVTQINDSETAMGLTGNVTAITSELRMKFIEPREELPFVPGVINVYDVFQEDAETITSGDTTNKKILKNPFPSYLMAVHIESDAATKAQYEVSDISIETRGTTWLELNRKEEYKLYNKKFVTTSDGSQYIHLFSKDLDRSQINKDNFTKDLIIFTQEMYPTYLTTTFNAASNSTMYITYEYINRFEISEDGIITGPILTGSYQYNKN